ncbi:hypothetical protein [uncultured Treponema sp.]|uniref:hypothetical protein n=1 Tax=uncultured Treponema sp. TaxID=162155 RepID=UPI0025E03762|nr:hypothetical protein [uncultured Treponema sp.]
MGNATRKVSLYRDGERLAIYTLGKVLGVPLAIRNSIDEQDLNEIVNKTTLDDLVFMPPKMVADCFILFFRKRYSVDSLFKKYINYLATR